MEHHKLVIIEAFKPLALFFAAVSLTEINTFAGTIAALSSAGYAVAKLYFFIKEKRQQKDETTN